MAESLTANLCAVPAETLAGWIGAGTLVPPKVAKLSLGRSQNSAALQKAGKAGTLPIALIHSADDRNGPVIIEETKEFAHVDITQIPGAGHIVFYDAPEATIDAILRFTTNVLGKH